MSYYSNDQDPSTIAELLQHRDQILSQLKHNLVEAQEKKKKLADKKKSEIIFNIGHWVMVKLQPYQQHSLVLLKNQKLGMGFFGPFHITHYLDQWLTSSSYQMLFVSIEFFMYLYSVRTGITTFCCYSNLTPSSQRSYYSTGVSELGKFRTLR